MRARKILKTLKNHSEKNERSSQRTHVQNHAYANKSRRTYVRDVRQLSNAKGSLLGLRQFLAAESPMKMMKSAF